MLDLEDTAVFMYIKGCYTKIIYFLWDGFDVAWKQKMLHDIMLHDVIGGHQAYIHRKIHRNMGNLILQLT